MLLSDIFLDEKIAQVFSVCFSFYPFCCPDDAKVSKFNATRHYWETCPKIKTEGYKRDGKPPRKGEHIL